MRAKRRIFFLAAAIHPAGLAVVIIPRPTLEPMQKPTQVSSVNWGNPITNGLMYAFPLTPGNLKNYGKLGGAAVGVNSPVWERGFNGAWGFGSSQAAPAGRPMMIDNANLYPGNWSAKTFILGACVYGVANPSAGVMGDRNNNSGGYWFANWDDATDQGSMTSDGWTGYWGPWEQSTVPKYMIFGSATQFISLGGTNQIIGLVDNKGIYTGMASDQGGTLYTGTGNQFMALRGREDRDVYGSLQFFLGWNRRLSLRELQIVVTSPWRLFR